MATRTELAHFAEPLHAAMGRSDRSRFTAPRPIIWNQLASHLAGQSLTQENVTYTKNETLPDNLPQVTLPGYYSFYALLIDPKDFPNRYGVTAIEYYVSTMRPKI